MFLKQEIIFVFFGDLGLDGLTMMFGENTYYYHHHGWSEGLLNYKKSSKKTTFAQRRSFIGLSFGKV